MRSRLRRLREAKGLTQVQLAAQAGVSVGALRCWEQGRRVPLLETAAKLAGALGVIFDELVTDTVRVGRDNPPVKRRKGK